MKTLRQKKRRVAKWSMCPWCVKRGMDPPMRFGKRKCLERHMVGCQADFLLESEFHKGERDKPSGAVLAKMIIHLQAKVSDVCARLAVLEKRKSRVPKTWWEGKSPRDTWRAREDNARRYIHAVRSCYEPGESFFIKNEAMYLGMFFSFDTLGVEDLLMLALWPCLVILEDIPCIAGGGSTDMYHTWKRIWGKSNAQVDFDWIEDVFKAEGLPVDTARLDRLAAEFEHAYRRFANTAVRAGSKETPQGLVAMARIRRAMRDPILGSDVFFKVARYQPPTSDSPLESEEPSCPPPAESEGARVESMSVVAQSSSDTLRDCVVVKLV